MEICNIEKCTGCGACKNICPVDCINIQLNKEGFYKYLVNVDLCIGCGLCKKVCPSNGYTNNREKDPRTYLAWSYDNESRIKSSSGGVFSELAERIINEKGVVYGASFDKNYFINHIGISNKYGLGKLRGSKYIQSHTQETFKEAKNKLEDGIHVLYSGTPCQIAGLYKFLGRDYENLLTCDLICHGVSSTKVYKDILDYYENKYKAKIIELKFRDKRTGWKNSSVTIVFDNGKKISDIKNISLLTYGFVIGITNNKVCGRCEHSTIPRRADISLGDYGGEDYVFYSKKDINDGISLVLINSKKGEKYLEYIRDRVCLEEKKLEYILKKQRNIYESNELHPLRDQFFEDYKSERFDIIKNKYFKVPIRTKILYKIGPERYKFLKQKIRKYWPLNRGD